MGDAWAVLRLNIVYGQNAIHILRGLFDYRASHCQTLFTSEIFLTSHKHKEDTQYI